MTEEQAIERIRKALANVQTRTEAMPNKLDREALAAWNEMKAMERLTSVMDKLLIDYPYGGDLSGHQIATAAWQEVKAIAREDKPLRIPLS